MEPTVVLVSASLLLKMGRIVWFAEVPAVQGRTATTEPAETRPGCLFLAIGAVGPPVDVIRFCFVGGVRRIPRNRGLLRRY